MLLMDDKTINTEKAMSRLILIGILREINIEEEEGKYMKQ